MDWLQLGYSFGGEPLPVQDVSSSARVGWYVTLECWQGWNSLEGLCWRRRLRNSTRGPEVNWGVHSLFSHLLFFITASKFFILLSYIFLIKSECIDFPTLPPKGILVVTSKNIGTAERIRLAKESSWCENCGARLNFVLLVSICPFSKLLSTSVVGRASCYFHPGSLTHRNWLWSIGGFYAKKANGWFF